MRLYTYALLVIIVLDDRRRRRRRRNTFFRSRISIAVCLYCLKLRQLVSVITIYIYFFSYLFSTFICLSAAVAAAAVLPAVGMIVASWRSQTQQHISHVSTRVVCREERPGVLEAFSSVISRRPIQITFSFFSLYQTPTMMWPSKDAINSTDRRKPKKSISALPVLLLNQLMIVDTPPFGLG